jgi:hypothetical protein
VIDTTRDMPLSEGLCLGVCTSDQLLAAGGSLSVFCCVVGCWLVQTPSCCAYLLLLVSCFACYTCGCAVAARTKQCQDKHRLSQSSPCYIIPICMHRSGIAGRMHLGLRLSGVPFIRVTMTSGWVRPGRFHQGACGWLMRITLCAHITSNTSQQQHTNLRRSVVLHATSRDINCWCCFCSCSCDRVFVCVCVFVF